MKIRYIGILFLCALLSGIISSCSDDEPIVDPIKQLRPSLSDSILNISVGDSAVLRVLNADTILSIMTNNPKVIAHEVTDSIIIVKALCEGEAIIVVNTIGARLDCDVIVAASPVPTYDFSKELQNTRSRYVSPSLTMNYDTPGTIFSMAQIGTVEVRSLITGDSIIFNPGTVELIEGLLPNATLHVNGSDIELQETILEKITSDNSMWLNLLDAKGNRIVLVVTDM